MKISDLERILADAGICPCRATVLSWVKKNNLGTCPNGRGSAYWLDPRRVRQYLVKTLCLPASIVDPYLKSIKSIQTK